MRSYHVVLGASVLPQVKVQAALSLEPLPTNVADIVLVNCVFDHVLL